MSFEVLGVTVSEPLPVGLQHVRLQPGLNVLYGKNGTGKTRILESVSRLLSTAQSEEEIDYGDGVTISLFKGGIHVSKIWDTENHIDPKAFNVARNWQGVLERYKWDQWIYEFLEFKPWLQRDKDALRDTSISWAFRHASEIGLSEEQWRWLIDQGRWLINPSSGTISLCDPSPYESPIRPQWERSNLLWQREFLEKPLADPRWVEKYLTFLQDRWPKGRHTPGYLHFPLRERVSNDREVPLPILPEMFGSVPPPSWVGYPILQTDMKPIWVPAVDSVWEANSRRVAQSDWDPLTEDIVEHVGGIEDRASLRKGEQAERDQLLKLEVSRIENNVNRELFDLFEEPPTIRIRSVKATVGYSKRPPILIEARFGVDSSWFPVSQLGDAHRRYVSTLVNLELLRSPEDAPVRKRRIEDYGSEDLSREAGFNTRFVELQSPSVAILDEPERGLHASAEVKLASAISSIADRVLVATHSVRFLDEGFKYGMTHLVTRNEMGLPEIRGEFPPLSEASQSQLRDDLGVGLGELALLTSVFVLVEGIHDQVLIEHFLQQEFRDQRVQIVPMQGTKGVEDLVTSPFIFVATAAPIVICLDNGRQAALEELLAALRNSKNSVDQISLINRNIDKFKTMEMTAVLGLLRQAVNKDQLWRVNPFFFSHRDILEYIPIRYFSDRFSSWDELDKQFLKAQGRTTFQAGDGRRKKDWMADQGINARERDLRRVVKEMAANGEDRPKEFGDLAELLLRVSRTRQSY